MRNEAQTRLELIDPALYQSHWKGHIQAEYAITAGRLIGAGKRGKQLTADYLLHYKNEKLAIIEAKREGLPPTSGLEQAKTYGDMLQLQWVYATNGKQIYEYHMPTGKGQYIQQYPSPEELYQKIHQKKGSLREKIINQPYSIEGGKIPRYYQELAINKTIEAICQGQKKILLTLATGTGKTVIAYQLAYKLYQAKWNLKGSTHRPKILFLADRNILADQAINTFNAFEKELVQINSENIRKNRGQVPTSHNFYFSIYQAIADREEGIEGYYHQYPADFFDLIIIDECHRGSAREEGSWRKILEHFDPAVQVGLTATPKRDENVDTYDYFGAPVYEYSLKEGIQDGFLSPYKVKKFKTTLEEYTYQEGDRVAEGAVEEDRAYNRKNYNRDIILYEHIELIAATIIDQINPYDKTIVFCVDQEHAANMRDAINQYKTIQDKDYCVRVTSDDGQHGRDLLEKFQDNDKNMPTIVTSSQMLTTGVDAKNVRNIVLVRNIGSMVEFKQIIGRGTRMYDGKDFFTILDFTDSCELFHDPNWEGLPEEEAVVKVGQGRKKGQATQGEQEGEPPLTDPPLGPPEGKQKIKVHLSQDRMLEISAINIHYVDEEGKPITAEEFLKRIMKHLPALYKDEQQLRTLWANPQSRKDALEYLQQQNISEQELQNLQQIIAAKHYDLFDVLNHLSHNKALKTRKQRANSVLENQPFFEVYKNIQVQDFLKFLLERYEQDGIQELDREKIPELIQLKGMQSSEVVSMFGGIDQLVAAFIRLQEEIYKAS